MKLDASRVSRHRRPRAGLAGKAAAAAVIAALALAPTLGAQEAGASPGAAASEEEMFGAEETVVQAAPSPEAPGNPGGFLKYDQVKVGGSIAGSLGFGAAWASAWDGSGLLEPDKRRIRPELEGKLAIVAKPSEDFGVNMDFRTSWPFSATSSLATAETDLLGVTKVTGSESLAIPNISVWALYSKFNWNDRIYFSFGKQPLSWGVSKGAFQPADDIFALSPSIDLEDTGAEREGPVSLKATLPLSATNNCYLYLGLPPNGDGSAEVDPADARLAAKVEYGFGDTELALGAFYAYADHPRALAMATTALGPWNLYGEAVLKYGSERYFIEEGGLAGDRESGGLYFGGTLGGYYSDADAGWTLACAYLYNGEAQREVSAKEALAYYLLNPDRVDRMMLGRHYAFASATKSKLVTDAGGGSRLSASLIAVASLSDLSGRVMPSLTWSFFEYASLKLGATFTFGEAGDEYILYGAGAGASDEPGAALDLTLSLGSGSF